jgi:hypothetical protein
MCAVGTSVVRPLRLLEDALTHIDESVAMSSFWPALTLPDYLVELQAQHSIFVPRTYPQEMCRCEQQYRYCHVNVT